MRDAKKQNGYVTFKFFIRRGSGIKKKIVHVDMKRSCHIQSGITNKKISIMIYKKINRPITFNVKSIGNCFLPCVIEINKVYTGTYDVCSFFR